MLNLVPIAVVVEVQLILLVASAFRTAFGFGEALIAVPLLALAIPIQVAAPIAVLASIVIAGFAVVRDWRHIHLGSAKQLILSTLFGIPLGLLLLKCGSEPLVKGILAGVLLAFSAYSLSKPFKAALRDDRLAWLFGFLAGVCGGSYGVNGPPLAIYGSLRGWTPERFRATLQGYFLPASALGMCGYWTAGLWTAEVNWLFLYSLPTIALGIWIGRTVAARLSVERFSFVLNVGLLLVAGVLIFQSLGLGARPSH